MQQRVPTLDVRKDSGLKDKCDITLGCKRGLANSLKDIHSMSAAVWVLSLSANFWLINIYEWSFNIATESQKDNKTVKLCALVTEKRN